MSKASVAILTEHLKAHLERLPVLREYYQNIDDPYVTTALSFVIEDTQEAVARVSSRLRQLGAASPGQLSEDTRTKLLQQARSQRSLDNKLRFIRRGLKHQINWYESQINQLSDDFNSQATLVALAEQTRLRLERWDNLMDEMKVSPKD